MHTSLSRFVGTVGTGVIMVLLTALVGVVPEVHGQELPSWAKNESVRKAGGQSFGNLGTDLAQLYRRHQRFQTSKAAGSSFKPKSSAMPVQDERVTLDILARSGKEAALMVELRALGAENLARSERLISGQVPILALAEVAELPSLHSANPAYMVSASGSVITQGDSAMKADIARSQNGFDGTGVQVGVLSDSYNQSGNAISAQDDIDSGDLPPSDRITVLQDAVDRTDEGRAMMQIIHDVTPGADLAFHTAAGGQANFAQGIRDLANAGSGVITDDILYPGEPMFQDGVIADAIEDVSQNGAAYFSAVGNYARQSHTDTFSDSGIAGPNGGTFHDFSGGYIQQRLTIPKGGADATFVFQWADPYASVSAAGVGADTDLNIYLENAGPDTLVAQGTLSNVGGDPIETLSFQNDTGSTDFDILIECTAGCSGSQKPAQMTYMFFNPNISIDEYQNPGPSGYGHVNAENSHAVAAAAYFDTPEFDGPNPPVVEGFSSEGGFKIYYDDNGNELSTPKNPPAPDVTGPDGGNTTFFGSRNPEGDSYPNFFGTSAAAPHVAGVAALMRSKNVELTPTEIYKKLEDTAVDMDDPATGSFDTGYDRRTGHGFVQADQALQSIGTIRPAAVTASVNRSFGSASTSSDYRLVALPGQGNRLIETVVEGEAGTEWQAFRDNGSDSDFLEQYDGSSDFEFRAGNGFWLISVQDWTVSDFISSVDLQSDAATVALQNGWNIISNPLDKDVSWSSVKTENGLSNPIWSFNGTFTNVVQDDDGIFDSARDGEAFYFKNEQGLSSLTIPYPSGSKSKAVVQKRDDGSTLRLSASAAGADGPTSTVRLGFSDAQKSVAAPPSQFEAVSLRIDAPDSAAVRTGMLMTQKRALDGDGETFDLRLTSQKEEKVDLSAANVSAVRTQSAVLVHPSTGRTYDLKGKPSLTVQTSTEGTALKLLVGSQGYVDRKTDDLGPSTLTLTSYPNPIRDQGTIEYGLPEASTVRLTVYDLLGRRVSILARGAKKAGRHTATLDASRFTSGVYFARLRAGGQTRTQKIVVVK
jgi:subtilisin family serine protease